MLNVIDYKLWVSRESQIRQEMHATKGLSTIFKSWTLPEILKSEIKKMGIRYNKTSIQHSSDGTTMLAGNNFDLI